MYPLLSKALKESQSKSPSDSMLTPPETLFNDGKEALENEPSKMIAPPTVSNESKPEIVSNALLFEITKPPPIEVKFEKSRLSNSSFEVIDNEPPTVVKVGISISLKLLLMKPNEALTFSNLAKETEAISLKVMLLAHSNSSKTTSTESELKETSKAVLTFCNLASIEAKFLLLLTLKVSKDETWKPSKDSKEVSEMYKVSIEETPSFKLIEVKAGKVTKLIVPTVVKTGKSNVLKMVNSVNESSPVTLVKEPAENEANEVALLIMIEP